MMRSLYSGVAGLKTHQTKMDVIGNNIANVNTVGYKSQSVTFNSLMYQTTQAASGATATVGGTNAKQIGLGVRLGAINTNIEGQGSAQSTGGGTDIMITGENFFVVSNGTETFFTRDGSFYVDGAGNLAMTSTGYNVMGWGTETDANGNLTINQDTVQPLAVMTAENLTYEPEATSRSYISGILDKNDSALSTASGKVVSLSFYDALGYSYTAKMSYHKTSDSENGEYYLQLDDVLNSTGTSLKDVYNVADINQIVSLGNTTANVSDDISLYQGSFTKNDDGTYTLATNAATPVTALTVPADATFPYTVPDMTAIVANSQNLYGVDLSDTAAYPNLTATIAEDGTLTISYDKTINGGLVQYNANTGAYTSVSTGTTTPLTLDNLTLDFNASVLNPDGTASTTSLGQFSDIEVDVSTSKNYSNGNTSTVTATAGSTTNAGTGRKVGKMSGLTISKDGMIYATYDNGQSRLMGQIATASFANPSGLSQEGDNLYSESLNSGAFDGVGVDITAGGGYMSTGVLEMSNVDLSSEFTEMITTQRGFQANSRIITVSDTMLEELTNLKR
ncbi:MAG: flagellar hook-basal body complex protein [Lachnospiraceae bacterium]|nr:flagellar hook-basal body complex protein [Lachnospiraceae bacterium]